MFKRKYETGKEIKKIYRYPLKNRVFKWGIDID